jgi:hypothetical protein
LAVILQGTTPTIAPPFTELEIAAKDIFL